MTSKPASCTPSDTVYDAAQLMKSKDVGPVPVINDSSERRVVGIVTDRDLTVKVLAEGRDPKTITVDEVMTRYPICCREDEDLNSALRLMSMNQIRRIPVVDRNFQLTGIISQADVARELDGEKTGAVVEDISSETGSKGGNFTEYESSDRSGPGAVAIAMVGAGLGIGLMYLMDPAKGQQRRTDLKELATKLMHSIPQLQGQGQQRQ
jgi:CBS domain-containing protein